MKTNSQLEFEIEAITDDIELESGPGDYPSVCNKDFINNKLLVWHLENLPKSVFIVSDITNIPVAIFYSKEEADIYYEHFQIKTGNRLSIREHTIDAL